MFIFSQELLSNDARLGTPEEWFAFKRHMAVLVAADIDPVNIRHVYARRHIPRPHEMRVTRGSF